MIVVENHLQANKLFILTRKFTLAKEKSNVSNVIKCLLMPKVSKYMLKAYMTRSKTSFATIVVKAILNNQHWWITSSIDMKEKCVLSARFAMKSFHLQDFSTNITTKLIQDTITLNAQNVIKNLRKDLFLSSIFKLFTKRLSNWVVRIVEKHLLARTISPNIRKEDMEKVAVYRKVKKPKLKIKNDDRSLLSHMTKFI